MQSELLEAFGSSAGPWELPGVCTLVLSLIESKPCKQGFGWDSTSDDV